MVSDKIKKVIIDKLCKDLSNVEIIPHDGSIWFIDRDAKYWYFELTIKGQLWWRYSFFSDFFSLFSMERNDYEPILGEWVEEVLNCKVLSTKRASHNYTWLVEEVLNCKVLSTQELILRQRSRVEEVLNHKVLTIQGQELIDGNKMEEVLNYKVV